MEFELESVETATGYAALLAEVFGVFFGLAVAFTGLFFVILSALVARADRAGDGWFNNEFASRKRVPLFHLLLGAGLMASGIIVAFFPF